MNIEERKYNQLSAKVNDLLHLLKYCRIESDVSSDVEHVNAAIDELNRMLSVSGKEHRRSSDIKLDDELLPEFADMWCRSCGDKVPSHLRNCPTLMSKI